MQTVIIVVHLIIVVALIGVVLLQRSEGGLGLGGGGGGGGGGGVSGFLTGRGQANALTRATAILATIFFATSLALSIIANRTTAPRSILDTNAPAASSAPAGQQGSGILDELQRLQGDRPAPASPPTEAPASGAPQVPQSR